MGNTQLIERIDLLPDSLREQVADFVEFLLNRYSQGNSAFETEVELTKEQLTELDRRYQAYLTNPDSTVSLETMKKRLMEKHGIPH